MALAEWTGRVDTKASIALSTELALIAAVIAVLGSPLDLPRGDGEPVSSLLYGGGVVLILLGALLAIWAVMPRLGGPGDRTTRPHRNYVYFGALRHWDVRELPDALRGPDRLEVLSEQLVAMSRVVWRKHQLVRSSLVLSAAGLTSTATAVLVPV
ncbi:Pycsar system effector family protein [Streptomyces sp. NPDC048172]|uniref:Pycsar system effector family protein n=1 Tax=Streptomyces sp. NPDC048172 TaxID=3365505 RepID=UPI00370F8EB5